MQDLDRHIEAIIFTASSPVSVQDIVGALNKAHELELDANVVLNHLESLSTKYEDEQYPFQIVEAGGGYQFLTKADYHQTISHFLNLKSRRRLSTAAMETLAIIAYRQPVTKTEIENIRGVNCDYSIQKLLEKELIAIQGRAETPGKPLLYGTSETFMDYFGINSVDDLPKLREFEASGDVLGTHPELAGLELPTPQEGAQETSAETQESDSTPEEQEEGAGMAQADLDADSDEPAEQTEASAGNQDSSEEESAEETTSEQESAEDVDSEEESSDESESVDPEVDEDIASADTDAPSTEEAEGEPEKA